MHRVKNYNYHRLLMTGRRFFYGRGVLDPFMPLNAGELVTTRIGMYSVMGAFSIRAYQRVRELLPEHRFDIVHDNQVLGYGTLLIKAMGLPVVATVHHPLDIDRANRIREARTTLEQVRAVLFYPFFMQRLVLRRVDRVVTVSETAARSVVRAFGLPLERVAVIWNGVDLSTFRRLPASEPQPGRILFVGDPEDRNKGFRYLLLALRELAVTHDFHLIVVQRSWSKRTEELALELGISDRVTFLDSLSQAELVCAYNQAQMLISPSLYEGFGLPVAEAMACGTPVVATDVGASAEVIEDGVSGTLVPPGEVKPMAAAIRALLEDPGLCKEMGAAGVARVKERFSWRRAAEETAGLYEEVLGQRKAQVQTVAVAR